MDPERVAMRVDAERNRHSIVLAARSLYAEIGLDVSMAEVARRAGVGKATLSRHFHSPTDLIEAVYQDRMSAYVAATERALAADDPWDGFVGCILDVCEMQAQNRGFADLLSLVFPTTQSLRVLHERAYQTFLQVIDRARTTGHLREDFSPEDVAVLLMANAGVVATTSAAAPDAWRRLVGQVLRGYATPGAPLPPLPDAPTPEDLDAAMSRDAGDGAHARRGN